MKKKKLTQEKIIKIVLGIVLATVGVWYIMLGIDIIPDKLPWLGYLDDAVMILVMGYIWRTIVKNMMGKK